MGKALRMTDTVRLGFACAWWEPREPTWSHIPAGLLHGLACQDGVVVTALDGQRPLAGKASLSLLHHASANAWQYGVANRWLTDRKISRRARKHSLDAVLAVGEAEPVLPNPTFYYQDMAYAVALSYINERGPRQPNLPRLSERRLRALADQQGSRYRQCSGVFTMGRWLAEWLKLNGDIPATKVHAVGGGLNAYPIQRATREPHRPRCRLLFVGRDFFRKGGDVAVSAVGQLRTGGAGNFRLTIVGPPEWPLEGQPPDWVDFLGAMPPTDVSKLWARHDLFVLPSWFEPYGLVFLEARAAGLPCIGRRAFAMPELVPDRAGALVEPEGGAEAVAAAIDGVSRDEAMFDAVESDADMVRRENSWSSVGSRVLSVVRETMHV